MTTISRSPFIKSGLKTYCLDSNVLIESCSSMYAFDIAPGYWKFLDEKMDTGEIFTSIMVYDEIKVKDDDLANWMKNRKRKNCFYKPDQEVQEQYKIIVDFVINNYEEPYANRFISKADPWVIALAHVKQATVVTHESLLKGKFYQVKIPNICQEFDVRYINNYDMIRELGGRIG